MKKGKLHNIGTILLIMVMVLTMIPFSAMAATTTAIKFEKTSDMKAEVGKNYRREAITTPEGAEVTYSSSDKSIATVDKNGRVKALAEGKATITAKSGNVKVSYNVVVSKAQETTTSTQPQKSVPKEGYKTIWECAKAHPGNLYYQKMNSGVVPGGWFPITKAKHKEYSERGFASIEEMVSVMGTRQSDPEMRTHHKQNPNTGRWSLYWYDNYTRAHTLDGSEYYTTIEEVIKRYPDAVGYAYNELVGWHQTHVGEDGKVYGAKVYNTKAEAEAYVASIMN